jgi:hypothetical protein
VLLVRVGLRVRVILVMLSFELIVFRWASSLMLHDVRVEKLMCLLEGYSCVGNSTVVW